MTEPETSETPIGPRRRRFWWSCTLEYDTQAPETARGIIDVPNPRLGVRRALEATQKQYPNRRFRSVVVVLDTESPDTPSVSTRIAHSAKPDAETLAEAG